FDGLQKTVDYGNFWPAFTELGPFFWEFWAMPGNNASATYMLSDGYGGLHALLFGFSNLSASEPGRYEMSGNVNDGISGSSHIFSFGSDSGPAVGEWGHLAVGWDGQNIITYFNGVPAGKTPYALPRQSTGIGNGAGRLLIGGSDHSNFHGRIAQVRGYEGSNPRMSRFVESSFAPETVFSREGNLLSYYFSAAPIVADFSRGYLTGSHVGVPRGTTAGILADCDSCPPPQFVVDSTAPNFATNVAPQQVGVPAPLAVPGGALVFDSFSRANSTYMFGGKGGLSSTEGGAAGPQVWQMKAGADQLLPFGILNGRVVLLGDDTSACWVNTGSTSGNLDIRVSRQRGRWGSGIDTGLSFRVVDHANYFFAYTSDSIASPGNQFLNVGSFLNGARSMIASGVHIPADWTTLRVVTRANGNILVFIDATQVYSANHSALANANKAGLFNNSGGLGLVNRWDNFMVFDAGP
ncbi:MAG TPA: LamG-like jellyroll fold domain-containing protein, partial [Pyrinomonadaceae bacterium]|nr:LamG-like jellyroll fold domain-containing protein [Pyrinomonadaceae bacterium]